MALANGLNANMLRRWVRESEAAGKAATEVAQPRDVVTPAFMQLPMSAQPSLPAASPDNLTWLAEVFLWTLDGRRDDVVASLTPDRIRWAKADLQYSLQLAECFAMLGDADQAFDWLENAVRCMRELRAGTVWINDPLTDNDAGPFGGFKQSGLGRELGREGLEAFQETKHVHMESRIERKEWWYPYREYGSR